MFALSRNSRPNDIVPVSAKLRMEKIQMLKNERDEYLEAQARAIEEKKYGMAACYYQMALAVNDRMNGYRIDPSVVDLVDGKR